MPALVLCLALPHSATALAAGQEARTQADEYMAIVEKYRSGQPDEAVVQLLTDTPGRWLAVADLLVKRGSTFVGGGSTSSGSLYRTASLMHARAAFSLWRGGDAKLASTHFNMARAFVDVSDRADGVSPTFRPRWYLATTLVTTSLVSPAIASMYLQDAVNRVPGDVQILTAAGWFSTRRANLPAGPNWTLRTAQRTRREQQEEAVRFLTQALAADPAAAEAALRLADVEAEMGRDAQAVQRLSTLLARDDLHRSIAYVGCLVLGRIRERQADTQEAERLYRQALALDPVAQSARLAIAQLSYSAGQADAAADLVDPLLSASGVRQGNDPWSDFRLAYPLVGQLIFDELRSEVQP